MKRIVALLALCLLPVVPVALAEPAAPDIQVVPDMPAAEDMPVAPDVPIAPAEADAPEGDDRGGIEAQPSYKGSYAAIADTGLRFLLPDDWRAVRSPSGVAGEVYSNGDGSVALTVATGNGNLADLRERYAAAVEDGTLGDCTGANVGGVDWVLITTADGMQYYAQAQIGENRVLSFVFVVSDPALRPEIEMEMIGSLTEN